ncbi:MAG TPA: hypothetical protein VKV32_03465 [Stellaceae bacterium]|nr:hypothetical protein [Stellaceae bacterium]
MSTENANRGAAELLAEVAKTRQQVARFRQAMAVVNDELVELALRARAEELENLAKTLEAQALKQQQPR